MANTFLAAQGLDVGKSLVEAEAIETAKKLLADHAGYPTSICKHGLETVTVFSIIVQVENLRAWIGRGRACETEYVEYQLEPYRGNL